MALARRVSKTFALKCLRLAWPTARIQVIKHPPQVLVDGYGLKAHPELCVWQVHTDNRSFEVVAIPDVLPFVAVREAYRCVARMEAVFTPIKGGLNFSVKPIPEPVKAP